MMKMKTTKTKTKTKKKKKKKKKKKTKRKLMKVKKKEEKHIPNFGKNLEKASKWASFRIEKINRNWLNCCVFLVPKLRMTNQFLWKAMSNACRMIKRKFITLLV